MSATALATWGTSMNDGWWMSWVMWDLGEMRVQIQHSRQLRPVNSLCVAMRWLHRVHRLKVWRLGVMFVALLRD